MVGECAFRGKREAKGTPWIDRTTVKCRPIIAGSRMGYRCGIFPGNSRTHRNFERLGLKRKSTLFAVDDSHRLRHRTRRKGRTWTKSHYRNGKSRNY